MKLQNFFVLLLLGLIYVENICASTFFTLKDISRLDSLRKVYITSRTLSREMKQEADRRLVMQCLSVTSKRATVSGDIHNYESMAIYYWPDTSTNSKAYILRDGYVNPEYNNYDGSKLFDLMYSCDALCNAYYISRDSRYASKCLELIDYWFLKEETQMYPNMDYGQFIPMSASRGNVGCMSEAICFVNIIDDIDMLHQLGMVDSKRNKALHNWFDEFATWMQESKLGRQICSASNNIGVDYDILLTRIFIYLGNKSKVRRYSDFFTSERLKKQIGPDGSQPNELKRSKAMMYSVYNLKHILDFCQMSKFCNKNFYEENKQIIDSSLTFLTQFVGHREKFKYQEISESWSDLELDILAQKRRIEKLKK